MKRTWLVEKRNITEMTQEEVAIASKIARTTYAMIEQGERGVSVPTAKKIAQVLMFNWTIFFEDQVRETSNTNCG